MTQRTIFFGKTFNIITMYFLAHFILKNFLKNPYNRLRVLGPEWCNYPRESINTIFMHLFAPFVVQNFQNIRVNPDLWRCIIFGAKTVQLPNATQLLLLMLPFYLIWWDQSWRILAFPRRLWSTILNIILETQRGKIQNKTHSPVFRNFNNFSKC